MAPQFTGTNALRDRSDSRWIERATSSLPVPDSPSTSTVLSLAATRRRMARRERMTADSPASSSNGS